MTIETHEIVAIRALSFVLEQDSLRDRFLAMSGVDAAQLKDMLSDHAALASVLEFLISHEPDLIDAAENQSVKPEDIVRAWRALGGGEGQEW